ncbi:hypothetical protein [Dactylosporangium sp. NPDC005555]|uniref:hypothetical protein n=1 Tax=Dactylosporangium sp. NPDC005555 TaxID=3154889 RepID=UPI0033B58E75
MTPVKPSDLTALPHLPDLADQVRMVVAVHVARDGMCGGCLSTWARLAPHPCQWMQWARAWLADPANSTSAQP